MSIPFEENLPEAGGGGADWDPMPLKLRFLEQLISLEDHGIDQTGIEFT